MKVIVRNGLNYSLITIPETELANCTACNEEVITEFTISELQNNYIERGINFTLVDGDIVFQTADVEAMEETIALGEKQRLINEAKELKALGVANLGAYRAQETIPVEVDPNRQLKLDKLTIRGQEITAEYMVKETALITAYGIDILDELI